jgi:hypothetical protein
VTTGGAPSTGKGIAISADGNSVYFSNEGLLYRRTGGAVTTEIGLSERTQPPVFTPGGSTTIVQPEVAHGDKVLLRSPEELTDEDDNAGSDLYIYDNDKPAGERLTLISKGDLPGDAAVTSPYAAAESLGRVYFLAENQVLAGEPNGPGPKLYLWEAGAGLSYVATLSAEDVTVPHVSSDGRYLAFFSKARQTAYDNAGQSEIYRYDAISGQVTCVSCEPHGDPATTSPAFNSASEVIVPQNPLRNVSSSGQVFFQTAEPLVPRDSNGQVDVYEYNDGVPHLISTGSDSAPASFLDASVSGNDVFFTTTERLVKWDVDDNYDVYDARANGGLPEPPLGVIGCEGDSCQPAPTPPNDPTPASANFNGAGNVPRKPPHKHKRKHLKKHHAKKQHAKKQHGKNATRKNG